MEMKRVQLVEKIEQRGEHDGRNGRTPNFMEAYWRLNAGVTATGKQLDELLQLLSIRYWMHYAAGLADPEEATDVTLRRWRDENDVKRASTAPARWR